MLTFTENMNRIEYLTAQTLVHVQQENYQKAREDLDNIHVHTTMAQKQLSDLEFAKAQGDTDTEAYSP
jgi:t-SNARE complex subunit (syntaxin)